MGAIEKSAVYGVSRMCLSVYTETRRETYKDTSPPKGTVGEKVRLHVDIAQATLGFRGELHDFMRELKQEAAKGKSGAAR